MVQRKCPLTSDRLGRLQPARFGSRDQNRIENESPAKKVDAARAVCPARKPRIAEAVHASMIRMISAIRRGRKYGFAGRGRLMVVECIEATSLPLILAIHGPSSERPDKAYSMTARSRQFFSTLKTWLPLRLVVRTV